MPPGPHPQLGSFGFGESETQFSEGTSGVFPMHQWTPHSHVHVGSTNGTQWRRGHLKPERREPGESSGGGRGGESPTDMVEVSGRHL